MQVELQTASVPSRINSSYLLQREYGPRVLDYNSEEPFVAASLAKLWVAATVFSLAEQKAIDLKEPLPITLEQLKKGVYGTGSRRWRIQTMLSAFVGRPLVTPKPLDFLLRRSISASDNLAHLVLADHVGRARIQQVVDSWYMYDTTIFDPVTNRPNITTADDIGLFLRNLKKGLLITPSNARLMQSWMQHNPFPSAENLPAHLWSFKGRTTEAGRSYFHKAGFVEVTGRDYVFAVLTRGPAFRRRGISYPQELKVKELMEMVTRNSV